MLDQIEMMHDLVDPAVVVPEAKVAGLDAQGFAHVEKGVVDQFLRHHAQRAARLAVVPYHIVDLNGRRCLAHAVSKSDTPYRSASVVKLGGRPVQVKDRPARRACRMALNMSASADESTRSTPLKSSVSTPFSSWGCNSRSRPPTLSTVTAPVMRQPELSHAITSLSAAPAGARCVQICRPVP